jgi:formylglycine-generating enzyme required for sulfatase activity
MNHTITRLKIRCGGIKFLLPFSFLILTFGTRAYTQTIENVRAEQQAKTVVITYDIAGADAKDKFTVKILFSSNGGSTFSSPLRSVTGDAGENIFGGRGKKITWNALNDVDELLGENFVFKIIAEGENKIIEGMVFVQGGTFEMGSNEGESDEKPIHSVTVSDFYIGKYEVTQKEWKAIMGNNPSQFKGDDLPVETVSWNDVQEYLQKLNAKTNSNYRLPTEAEWEYAARGGNKSNGYKYSGSNNIDNVAWYGGNSNSQTHRVGTKEPNELGIYDMSGNVWEWCNDWYGEHYYNNSPQNNPQGPTSGTYRVLRGGSWLDTPSYVRCAYRYYGDPTYRDFIFGFRCARTR